MITRTLQRIIPAIDAADGADVSLRRSLGARQGIRHDPFLMLDEFFSDDPKDYIGGFPAHPHRGFETVTYMLDGHMRHEDHLGNRGDLGPGDVQWMTAGRGIIHSEMPQQTAGRMRGFQLWLNLPAKEKMKPASYRDIPAAEIPTVTLTGGAVVRVIAGTLTADGNSTEGPIQGLSTSPLYFDVHLPAGKSFTHALPSGHNAFIYLYEGALDIAGQTLPNRAAGLLSAGDQIEVTATEVNSRFLLLAGKPIGEPVVQYGPFVMNTSAEIEQAVADFRAGTLAI